MAICRHEGKTIKGKHIFYLEEYKKLTKEELEFYIAPDRKNKKIFCYETRETFNSMTEFHNKYGVTIKNINYCCKLNSSLSDKSYVYKTNGKSLFYFDDYVRYGDEKIGLMLLNKNKRLRKIECITTGEFFDSITSAERKYPFISGRNIGACCSGKRNYAGMYNNQKLKWRYC